MCLRARIYALYGRSVRAGARDFSVFHFIGVPFQKKGRRFLERRPGCLVMLVSRLGLVPDLDTFSRDADGALGVNFVLCHEALVIGLGLRSLVA